MFFLSIPCLEQGLCTRLFEDSRPLTTTRPSLSAISSLSRSDDSKCLAYLTAKATVWSRALLPLQTTNANNLTNRPNQVMISNNQNSNNRFPSSLQGSSISYASSTSIHSMHWTNFCTPRGNGSQLSSILCGGEPLKPLLPLRFSSRQQPHFSLRRVLQIGYDVCSIVYYI